MEHLFGSCEVLLSCDTKQFDYYSKYEVDYFDVPSKLKRHEEVFPLELQKAHELGVRLSGEYRRIAVKEETTFHAHRNKPMPDRTHSG